MVKIKVSKITDSWAFPNFDYTYILISNLR